MKNKYKLFLQASLSFAICMLSACSHYQERHHEISAMPSPFTSKKDLITQAVEGDGPPLEDIDLTHLQNATPKVEPLSRYGNPASYEVFGDQYHVLPHGQDYVAEGHASWYGRKFHGKRTSSGERYDMFAMTAAHRSLPLPTYAKVKNLHNGKEIIVKINDRGPFVKDRLIDLSYAAAKKLGVHQTGTARVRVSAIDAAQWQAQENKSKKMNKQAKTQLAANKSRNKTTESAKSKIYIQLGAFNDKNNAQNLAKKASTLTQVLAHVTENKEVYKVRLGPLKDKKEAEQLKQKLATLRGSNTKLVYE
jgi:rare lipoprotein A